MHITTGLIHSIYINFSELVFLTVPISIWLSATLTLIFLFLLILALRKLRKKEEEIASIKKTFQAEEKDKEQTSKEVKVLTAQVTELRDVIKYQKEKFSEHESKYNEIENKLDEEVLKRTTELHTALEKSQESNKLKQVFLEKISREIRTPLNAILGFINLLNDPNLSRIDREYYFKFIRESGNNLLALIDNIIDFTRLETGELIIEERKCNLNLLLGDLVDKYRSRIVRENPNIAIVYNKLGNIDEKLVDCKRIIHILDQILHNAVKFTQEGKIEVNFKAEDNNYIIEVIDTGIGIEKKYQEIIFERFYQIESESRDVFQGAGLGLTIAKGITDLLGGKISLRSKPKQGTSFTVQIPFKELPSDGEIKSPSEQNLDWKDKVILIAEDEDSNYFFLEAILKRTNVTILRAEDGVMFLEIMNTNKNIDLVLLDIKMPGINGFSAIKVVRQQNINIPVIAQTAFNQPEDKQKCLDSGCDDYLAKPIDRELLMAKISHFFTN